MTRDPFSDYQDGVSRKLAEILAGLEATAPVEQVRRTAELLADHQTLLTIHAASTIPDLADEARRASELLQRDFSPAIHVPCPEGLLERAARLAVIVPQIVSGSPDLDHAAAWALGTTESPEWERRRRKLLALSTPTYLRLNWKHRAVTSCLAAYLSWSSVDLPGALHDELLDVAAHLDLHLPAAGYQSRFLLTPPPVTALLESLLGAVPLGQHEPGDDVSVLLVVASEIWTPAGVNDTLVIPAARALVASLR
jgi:hypothetical protein